MKRLTRQLLTTSAMTAAERAKGRFMRAPDGHPAPVDPGAEVRDIPPAPQPDGDAFADAFKQHAADTPVAPPAPPAGDPPANDPPAGDPPAGDPPANEPPANEPPANDPPAAPPAPPAPAQQPSAADIAAELARNLQQQSQQQPEQQPQQQPEVPIYTPDEQQVLADFHKDWPDVAKASALERRAEYHDLLKYVFAQVNTMITPLQEQMRTVGNTLHTSELRQLVPDYEPTLEQDVAAWIETQPGYLQGAMKQVMQVGTSDEVADLIGRYRAQTGTAAPAPNPPSGQPPAAPAPAPAQQTRSASKSELSHAAKQAAAALAPVGGERTQVPQGDDPQDFRSAFARFATASG